MARPRKQFPKPPSDHKGQARTWWDGGYVHLGKFGSPEAAAAYANLLRTIGAGEPVRSVRHDDVLVCTVLAAHLDAVGRKLGDKEASVVGRMVETVLLLHGNRPLSQFGPKAVIEWMHLLAAGDASLGLKKPLRRSTLRRYLRLLKEALRWGIKYEVTAADRFPWADILEVQAAEVDAAPSAKVLPVEVESVYAALPHLLPPVAALVQVQLLTGMRPNDELFEMRPADIHRRGTVLLSTGISVNLDKINSGRNANVWVYVPRWHKQQHAGGGRDVPLGPRAQAVIVPFLDRDPQAFCFSPREAMDELRRRQRAARAGGGNLKKPRQRVRQVGDRYTADSYRRAIKYACVRAGVPVWFPYRIRHTAATETQADAGLDVARALLGQSDPRTTLRYAERDFRAAAEQVRKAG